MLNGLGLLRGRDEQHAVGRKVGVDLFRWTVFGEGVLPDELSGDVLGPVLGLLLVLAFDPENVVDDAHLNLVRPVAVGVQADLEGFVVVLHLDGLVVDGKEVLGFLLVEDGREAHYTTRKGERSKFVH